MTPLVLPNTTMMGALFAYITQADPRYFQPMKSNFGLLPDLETHVRNKGDRYLAYAQRALQALEGFMAEHSLSPVAVRPQHLS
jgi:methylenetetrahydrofolate--tRNA-(uracil-5-)-methyltransferase